MIQKVILNNAYRVVIYESLNTVPRRERGGWMWNILFSVVLASLSREIPSIIWISKMEWIIIVCFRESDE